MRKRHTNLDDLDLGIKSWRKAKVQDPVESSAKQQNDISLQQGSKHTRNSSRCTKTYTHMPSNDDNKYEHITQ
jgi:hypothetical protein